MESLLKQRLIGAITLVVLGVLIIPLILNGPPEGRRPTIINQPVIETTSQSAYKPPAAPVTVRVDLGGNAVVDPIRADVASNKKTKTSVSSSSSTKTTATNKPPQQHKGQQKVGKTTSPKSLLSSKPIDRYSSIDDVDESVAAKKRAKPNASTNTPRKASSQSKRQRYVIQMGIFGEQRNAIALRSRLEKLGYRVKVEQEFSGTDSVYRVYVGPYPHRQAADASREVLARRAKLRGFLKNYP